MYELLEWSARTPWLAGAVVGMLCATLVLGGLICGRLARVGQEHKERMARMMLPVNKIEFDLLQEENQELQMILGRYRSGSPPAPCAECAKLRSENHNLGARNAISQARLDEHDRARKEAEAHKFRQQGDYQDPSRPSWDQMMMAYQKQVQNQQQMQGRQLAYNEASTV